MSSLKDSVNRSLRMYEKMERFSRVKIFSVEVTFPYVVSTIGA